jgi:hypothetical protein
VLSFSSDDHQKNNDERVVAGPPTGGVHDGGVC